MQYFVETQLKKDKQVSKFQQDMMKKHKYKVQNNLFLSTQKQQQIQAQKLDNA